MLNGQHIIHVKNIKQGRKGRKGKLSHHHFGKCVSVIRTIRSTLPVNMPQY